MIGNLCKTNFTSLVYAYERYVECPNMPNPVMSVAAETLYFLNNEAAAKFNVPMLYDAI